MNILCSLGFHKFEPYSIKDKYTPFKEGWYVDILPRWKVTETKICARCFAIKVERMIYMYPCTLDEHERKEILKRLKERRGVK